MTGRHAPASRRHGGLQHRSPTSHYRYTTTPYFSDVPSTHGFFKYVQKLKDLGITKVSGTYSVDREVTRAEMAAFLVRAFLNVP